MRIAVGLIVTLGVVACAGKSIRNEGDGGQGGEGGVAPNGGVRTGGVSAGGVPGGGVGGTSTGAVGNAPATGGTSTGGGSAGTTATGGRAGTTATGGQPGLDCSSSPDPGPCEGLMRRYAFDPETSLCLPFVYGGCDGNANNFETSEDCYRTCESGGGVNAAACGRSSECMPIPTNCCGCDDARWDNVVGVNGQYSRVISSTKCATVDCDACVPPNFGWFASLCVDNHCVAYDLRETYVTGCTTDAACSLRNGLGCCEACTGDASTLVSLNDQYLDFVCPDGAIPCPPCIDGGPTYPASAHAACVNERCVVTHDLR